MPAPYDFWKQDIMYLKGVGPKRAAVLLSDAGIRTYEDLLHYYPRKHIDRSRPTPIASLNQEGQMAVVIGQLGRFESTEAHNRIRLNIALSDGKDFLALTWFKGARFIAAKFKMGDTVVVYGRVSLFRDQPQMSHPEMELLTPESDTIHSLKLSPLYPSTEALKRQSLDSKGFRQLLHTLFELNGPPPLDALPDNIRQEQHLVPLAHALRQMHFPDNWEELQSAQLRLKFDEFFLFELVMGRRRHLLKHRKPSPPFVQLGDNFHTFYKEHLPFELTNAQKRVVREIRNDVFQPQQMNRLVQGDVGSGKTIVALFAMLMAIDNGYQAALMAPTAILAEQHFRNIHRLLEPLGIETALLVGGQKTRIRKSLLASIANGQTQIAVGTHAIIQEPVQFQRLGLTIIDEQHKFGVLQRAKLWSKAALLPHNIAMSATPIPRTLAMTVYGDIDVSLIDELPPGRKPVQTVVRNESQRLAVFGFLRKQMELGRQVYVVYPLVEESSKLDLLAAENGYEAFERAFPDFRVTMIHGRMKPDAKEYEMIRFQKRQVHLLVSTTVIEVGVDVPNASVMVIENSERFGLSQLHQLRGRVGRGADQAYCILMAGKKLSDTSKQRLSAMVETTDGFRIAEIDLKLRGPGDFLGTRQSGLPEFRLGDIIADTGIVEQARRAAFALIEADPQFDAPEHAALKEQFLRFIAKNHLQDLVA